VLATITDQPDIEVVGVLEDDAAIVESVEQAHPDFVIIGLDRSEDRPKICDVLLSRFPRIRTLAMASEHNSTISYWAFSRFAPSPGRAGPRGPLARLREIGMRSSWSGCLAARERCWRNVNYRRAQLNHPKFESVGRGCESSPILFWRSAGQVCHPHQRSFRKRHIQQRCGRGKGSAEADLGDQ
jgi:hypothetical protein